MWLYSYPYMWLYAYMYIHSYIQMRNPWEDTILDMQLTSVGVALFVGQQQFRKCTLLMLASCKDLLRNGFPGNMCCLCWQQVRICLELTVFKMHWTFVGVAYRTVGRRPSWYHFYMSRNIAWPYTYVGIWLDHEYVFTAWLSMWRYAIGFPTRPKFCHLVWSCVVSGLTFSSHFSSPWVLKCTWCWNRTTLQ